MACEHDLIRNSKKIMTSYMWLCGLLAQVNMMNAMLNINIAKILNIMSQINSSSAERQSWTARYLIAWWHASGHDLMILDGTNIFVNLV
jgi:hypothetical protein